MAPSCNWLVLGLLLQAVLAACTRYYDFTITWEDGAPDGQVRKMFKINGQFPGPTITLNESDDVVVTVKNLSPKNTTIHFHGIEMIGTPWSDGTPGLSQNEIQPGRKFVYRWKATQHGSFWYHGHTQSQLEDGLLGPIVIHPAPSTPDPYHFITRNSKSLAAIRRAEQNRTPLVLSDWRKLVSDVVWDSSKVTGVPTPCFDSMLLNGKGQVNCLTPAEQNAIIMPEQIGILSSINGSKLTDKSCLPPEIIAAYGPSWGNPDVAAVPHNFFYGCNATKTPYLTFPITQQRASDETWAMFDLIGAFSSQTAQVSLDEMAMYVVAADGSDIEPVLVNSVGISNGERYTVLVKLEKSRKYTLRISSTAPSFMVSTQATIDFRIRGQKQDPRPTTPWINPTGQNLTANVIFFDSDSGRPYPPQTPPNADVTYINEMLVGKSASYWAFNETILPENSEELPALLLSPQPGRQDNHTITTPGKTKWVDYIMLTPGFGPNHPVHVHGRHFYVLGRGTGNWTWNTVEEAAAAMPRAFNLENPPLRDTYLTLGDPGSWMALRRPSDNPGVWLMHCHILSHIQGGQSMILQDGVDVLPPIPKEYRTGNF
ncbi:Cupredoxin-like protein [Xylogone sp. PMI_703]|nr:Cupredoxin-like protein [Xylogone sp. PMI_703]